VCVVRGDLRQPKTVVRLSQAQNAPQVPYMHSAACHKQGQDAPEVEFKALLRALLRVIIPLHKVNAVDKVWMHTISIQSL
jgi:hypothetical protein